MVLIKRLNRIIIENQRFLLFKDWFLTPIKVVYICGLGEYHNSIFRFMEKASNIVNKIEMMFCSNKLKRLHAIKSLQNIISENCLTAK